MSIIQPVQRSIIRPMRRGIIAGAGGVVADQIMVTGQNEIKGVTTTGYSSLIGSLTPVITTFTQGEVTVLFLAHINSAPARIVLRVTTATQTDSGFTICDIDGSDLVRADNDGFSWLADESTWEWHDVNTGFNVGLFLPVPRVNPINYEIPE